MKKILFLLIAIGLWSCDDRFNFLASYNHPPVLTANRATTSGETNNLLVVSDSIKISFKHGTLAYTFEVDYTDPDQNITNISVGFATGSCKIQLNGADIPSTIPVTGAPLQFVLSNFVEGAIIFNVSVQDAFGASATTQLKLICFNNIPPIAKYNWTLNNVNSDPYQVSFDASSSYDKDQAYGGGIQGYLWTLNGIQLPLVKTPVINQVFPGSGTYQCTLVVYDNDGAPSPAVTQSVTIK